MALTNRLNQREFEKFMQDATYGTVVKVQDVTGGGLTTGIGDGTKTVTTAGARVPLATSTACKSVIITAWTTNTGVIVVGGTTVAAAVGTRRGTPLSPGDSISFSIDDLNDVNLDSTVSAEGVWFTYFT